MKESKSYDILPLDLLQDDNKPKLKEIIIPKLPKDSINLFDPRQVEYYKDNKVVLDAVSVIKKRKLDTAVNRPDSLWVSLSDKTHKNRLIIPFCNVQNEIIFYQSRIIYDKDARFYPKYLSKINSEKSLCGVNKIQSAIEMVYGMDKPPISLLETDEGLKKIKKDLLNYEIRNRCDFLGNSKDSLKIVSADEKAGFKGFQGWKGIVAYCLDDVYNVDTLLEIYDDTNSSIFPK
jgi:hypothetical protein